MTSAVCFSFLFYTPQHLCQRLPYHTHCTVIVRESHLPFSTSLLHSGLKQYLLNRERTFLYKCWLYIYINYDRFLFIYWLYYNYTRKYLFNIYYPPDIIVLQGTPHLFSQKTLHVYHHYLHFTGVASLSCHILTLPRCLENSGDIVCENQDQEGESVPKRCKLPGLTTIFILFLLPSKHFLEKGTNYFRNFIFCLHFCGIKGWKDAVYPPLIQRCSGWLSNGYRFLLPAAVLKDTGKTLLFLLPVHLLC